MSSATVNTLAHPYIPARSSDSRSPCPALNALANHGYIRRRGTKIHFTDLLHAVRTVYNLTLPLAFLLTLVGFITCAKFSLRFSSSPSSPISPISPLRTRRGPWPCEPAPRVSSWTRFTLPSISWTLDLESLSTRGWDKIAHDGSLVHASGAPTHAPDPTLLQNLLIAADKGLTLHGLADYHAERVHTLTHRESAFHSQVGLGECALTWLVLHTKDVAENVGEQIIDPEALRVWMGNECLPDAWCGQDQNQNARRPGSAVGLREARAIAVTVGKLSESASR